MHETLSSKFKGYIDKIETSNGNTTVEIWIAGEQDYTYEDVRLSNRSIPYKVDRKDRPDVYAHYKESNITYLKSGLTITFQTQPSEVTIMVGNEPIFKVSGGAPINIEIDNIIKLNKDTKPELIVVDNFYQNPDTIRKYALSQEFKSDERYHKGNRTQKSYIPSWAKAEFSRLLNRQVTEFVGATGVFQYCVAKDNVVYHYDTQEYAAMVYLSPNAPLQTGTQTFRSKLTGLYGAATDKDAISFGKSKEEIDTMSFNGNNFYDRHNMELVDSIANIYNRCVIFNARSLHAATSYYGSNREDSRLFHLYFFNCQ